MGNVSAASTIQASKIISMFDIEMPEVRNKFFRIRGNQGLNFFMLMENLGYSRPVAAMKTRQYEEDWIHQTIHIGNSMTATGNPNEYTFELSSVAPNIDYLEQNTTSPYSSADQYVFPIEVWDIITLPENNAKLQVTNKTVVGSTCTLVVKHMNPSVGPFTLANYGAGTELIVTGNAYSEGSDQDGGKVWKPLVDYAHTQIIKSNFKVTGTQLTQQIWFKEFSDGRGIEGYYIVGQENTEYEHALAIDAALLFGALTEISIIDPTTNEPIQTTEGIDPYIKRKGNNIPYVPGTFNVGMFDYMDKLLEQEGAPAWMGGFLGTDLDNEKDNVFKDYFNNTSNQDYMRSRAQADLFGDNPGIASEVNFRYFHKGYRNYCFTRMPQFNMVKLYGAPGYKAQNLGLFWPLASKPDKNNPNNRIPYMGMIYKAMGDYSRKVEVFNINGAGPGQKVTSADRNKLCMRSDIGAEHCGGNAMIRLFAQ